MILAFSFALTLQTSSVGWHDELYSARYWKALEGRPVVVSQVVQGAIDLSLPAVPADWPYEYQWSGVTRPARVNIGYFPILQAQVTELNGYAHLDVDVLDAKGAVVDHARSNTLTAPGITTVDLGKQLKPRAHRLRLRLIVGGPNAGCSARYDWIRFVGPSADAT